MALLGTDTKVTGPLKEGVLLLETFHGQELLGAPYRYDLTLLSDDAHIGVDKVLGQSVTVHIKLDNNTTRYFNGIVTYFAKTGMAMHHTRYVATLNPMLSLFDYSRDCRILFKDDAPTHAFTVLSLRGFTEVETGALEKTYRQREYTVQYRESDLNFVQRLLEGEGIYYFFRHQDDKHTMVLADSTTPHAKVPGYENVLYLPKQRKQAREEEHFWSLTTAGSLYPGKFSVLRGYDPEKPRPQHPQIEKQLATAPQPGPDFEDYDYPGGLPELPDAWADAMVRVEREHVANTIIEVEGNTMGLGVGNLVKLKHPVGLGGTVNPFWADADFDKEYLITAATYSISINQYESGDVADSDEPFKATFRLLDSNTPYHPPRTATNPRIEGPQTALVVGPTGDEIHTDYLGRVRVQFDWDRLGDRNEKSSIWVRVAQVWAGKQWGAIHIPRIGQEVIVDFLDGDPDRPIVTGRVYNADNMPPYELPKNQTQSGIKSRSSKGGSASNFNEIRFEDLKGKEEVAIHAERNMSTTVEADQSVSVGGDRTVTVTGKETIEIKKAESLTVHEGRTELIEKGDNLSVKASDKSIEVDGQYATYSKNMYQVLQGPDNEVLLNDAIVSVKNKSCTIKFDATNATLTAADSITLECGSSKLTMKKDGTIEITGTTGISLQCSGSEAVLTPSGVDMKRGSSTVAVDDASTTVAHGASEVKLTDASADVKGTLVNVTGSSLVKING